MLVNIVSVMPQTSLHAISTHAAGESKTLIVQLPPLAAWQQRRVRYAINLLHLTADSAGYPPSTPLFYFVPGSDISCPCENNPEIWSGRECFKIDAPGC